LPRVFLAAIALVAASAFMFWPLFAASYQADDWHFFALFRHIDSIAAFFTTNIGGTYFYRPIALTISWITFQLFDLNSVGHYAVNIALHAWVAFEIGRAVYRYTQRLDSSFVAAALFFACPITTATATWFSNRFDLIATGATFAAINVLIYATELRASVTIRLSLWLLLALGAKETGFASVVAICLLLQSTRFPLKEKMPLFATLVLVVLLSVFARLYALNGFTPEALVRASYLDEFVGVFRQVLAFGESLRHLALPLGALFVCAFLFVVLNLIALRNDHHAPDVHKVLNQSVFVSRTALVGCLLALLFACLFVQAPIAKLLFENPANAQGSNLRFFYLPVAALVCAFAIATSAGRVSSLKRQTLWVWCCPFALFAYETSQYSESWKRHTRAELAVIQSAEVLVENAANSSRERKTHCHIQYEPDLGAKSYASGFMDAAVKARAKRDDSKVNCILITDPPQAFSLTKLYPCTNATINPLVSVVGFLPPMDRSGTCSYLQVAYR
jgi:hypothetical protein